MASPTGKRKASRGRLEAGIDKNGNPINKGMRAMAAMNRKKDMPLTFKMQKFVWAYLGDAKMVAIRAMKMAGYTGTEACLYNMSAELLRDPRIRKIIDKKLDGVMASMGYTDEAILREVISIAFSDVAKFVEIDEENNVKIAFKPGEQDTGALSSIDVTTIRTAEELRAYVTKIKMHDKKWALETLIKLRGMGLEEKGDTSIHVHFHEGEDGGN